MRCEDFPCCGHTDQDPCGPQWYDAPGAFDTTVNPHALCDHENGECDVDEYEEDDYYEDGEYIDSLERESIDGDWYHVNEDAAMEFGLWGSEA